MNKTKNKLKTNDHAFTAAEIAALKPGDLVRFGQTTYGYVSNWLEGVVLAVGESQEWGSDRVVPGAVVAWHNRFPHEGYPADHVSFTPFWNGRFQPVRGVQ